MLRGEDVRSSPIFFFFKKKESPSRSRWSKVSGWAKYCGAAAVAARFFDT